MELSPESTIVAVTDPSEEFMKALKSSIESPPVIDTSAEREIGSS